MTAPNNIADKFVLLFSADWFRPNWALTGFVPIDGGAFQRDIRDIVERMMDDAPCYWHIDFSEARLRDTTREGFLERARSASRPAKQSVPHTSDGRGQGSNGEP